MCFQIWSSLRKAKTPPSISQPSTGHFIRSQSERWRTNPSFRLATSQKPVVVRKDVLSENPDRARMRRRFSETTVFSQTSV